MKRPDPHIAAADMKWRGIRKDESWSKWIQQTGLQPGMDAKKWYTIWDSVGAAPAPESPRPEQRPTHRILHAGVNGFWREVVVIKQHKTHLEYYWPDGGLWCNDPWAGISELLPIEEN